MEGKYGGVIQQLLENFLLIKGEQEEYHLM